MKRVISDVFPTDCSPRNTSLNLRIALLYSLPPLVVAISSAHRPPDSTAATVSFGPRGPHASTPGAWDVGG